MATIEKRGDSYRITVSCGYDVNGKQIKQKMTWKPDKEYTEKQLQKELKRQATLFEEKVKSGKISSGGNMRLADFIPQYLENVKGEMAETTLKSYKRIIDRFIVPALGHLKLKEIKPLQIQKFVNELTTGELRQDGKGGTYKPATVRRYYVVLQSILHNAYQLQLITENPADSGIIKLPSIGEQTTEIFTKEELSEMLNCLNNEPLMFQTLICLAIATGARRGELVALTWKDIDLERGIITISKSAYAYKGQTGVKDTKTHKSRVVKIPTVCINLLEEWRIEQAEKRLKLGTVWIGENWVFIQNNGKMLYPTSPTLMFSKFLKRNNLKHKKFHALRHTSATVALSSGVNIKAVAARLGHTQLSTTNRYVHAIEEAEQKAADVIGEILTIDKKKTV